MKLLKASTIKVKVFYCHCVSNFDIKIALGSNSTFLYRYKQPQQLIKKLTFVVATSLYSSR